jgi:outer membrane protein assembly factor BamB
MSPSKTVASCLLAVAVSAPCLAQSNALLGNPQVAPLGLETAWSTYVRVDPTRGRVASLQLIGGLLLAQTDQGTVQAIHPESGRTLWTANVGSPAYPTQPPGANDKFVGVSNGTTYYLFDRASGATVWQQRVSGSPSAGSSMNDDRVYVPLDNGLIEAYLLARTPGRELYDSLPKRYSGSGPSVTAPLVIGKRCNWAVSEGYVYSAQETFKDLVQFRFHLDDDAGVGPTYMAPYLFAASRLGTVFAMNETNGSEIWRFSLGNPVSHPLLTIDGGLYVISETGDMVRLDPHVGSQVWYGRGVRRFVAAGADRIYALDTYGRLTARDAMTGMVLGAVPVPGFDLPCYNVETDRLYLATRTGLVQCLRESRSPQPLAHTPGPPAGAATTTAAGATEAAPAADPAATPAAPAAANPFATP